MSHLESSLLHEAVAAAEQLGYKVVVDMLDGCGGGVCETGGSRWLMLDSGGTASDRLAHVVRVLQADVRTRTLSMSSLLRQHVTVARTGKAA